MSTIHPGIGVSMSEAEYNESIVAQYEAGTMLDRARAMFAASGTAELEARVEAADTRREDAVLRTIFRAGRSNLGWTGNATDVLDLLRILRRAGVCA